MLNIKYKSHKKLYRLNIEIQSTSFCTRQNAFRRLSGFTKQLERYRKTYFRLMQRQFANKRRKGRKGSEKSG